MRTMSRKPQHTTRYRAYCVMHGLSPELMLIRDQALYPGATMTGFFNFLRDKFIVWDDINHHVGAHSPSDKDNFKRWLYEIYLR